MKALQTNIDYYPMLLRYYPISNLRCKEGNIQAQLTMLECFYNALELGASFYQQHKPLHVIYDDKVIDIRHREPASKTISNFIKDALLADLLFEIAEKTLDKVFVKRKYGRQGKCGYITIDSELKSEKDRPLEDFTEKEDNFRLLNLYSEPSFFGTLIE